MNIPEIVNIAQDREADQYLRRVLRELLEAIPWLTVKTPHKGRGDLGTPRESARGFSVKLETDKRSLSLAVETRRRCEPRVFRELARRRSSSGNQVNVLGVIHATPRLAQVCQEEGWSWFDGAGNCRLDVPGVLFIERTGKRPAPEFRLQSREPNLRSPEAARVVRALLSVENTGRRWVQREMVQHFEAEPVPISPPSLALVNKLVRELSAQDLLATWGRGFEVSNPDALLKMWVRQYPFERQIRRRYFTLLREEKKHQRLAKLAGQDLFPVAYGVFSAANQQAPHVVQPRTWLYVHPDYEAELASQLEARSVDSGDNLVLLIPDDLGVFYQLDRSDPVPCTNLVQTCVDLSHAGGRGQEGAEALRTQRLLPAWKAGRNARSSPFRRLQ